MINFNGKIISESAYHAGIENRAFKYGDAIFDTLKYDDGEIYFLEDHYFRLMSSMRMLRMNIPMALTLAYYETEIKKTVSNNDVHKEARVRVSVSRKDGGLYTPDTNDVDFLIEVNEREAKLYDSYEIELFKDFPVYSGLLSTIKTNNRMINVLSSIFSSENNFQNCILINEKKNIVEANNANIFLIKGDKVLTPALTEGCINGIVRKKIIELLADNNDFTIEESAISPFELLKADEVFLTNSITEFQTVNKYRKKIYNTDKTNQIKQLFWERFNKKE